MFSNNHLNSNTAHPSFRTNFLVSRPQGLSPFPFGSLNKGFPRKHAPGELSGLKARKRLYLTESMINSEDFKHMKLKKRTLKTILKKQSNKKQISHDVLASKSILNLGEVFGYKLQKLYIRPHLGAMFMAHPPKYSCFLREIKQYRKIMVSSKQLKTLSIDFYMNLPVSFIKDIGINRNLSNLSLFLRYPQFIVFPSLFKHIVCLEKLNVLFHFNSEKYETDQTKAALSFKLHQIFIFYEKSQSFEIRIE